MPSKKKTANTPEEYLPIVISIGEKSGDIPLFDIRKINKIFARKPIITFGNEGGLFLQMLAEQRQLNVKKRKRNVYFITGSQTIIAIKNAKQLIAKRNGNNDFPKTAKAWLVENFYEIINFARVPNQILEHLREKLAAWAADETDPFEEKIEKMVLAVARNCNIVTAHPDYAWEKMGGSRIF